MEIHPTLLVIFILFINISIQSRAYLNFEEYNSVPGLRGIKIHKDCIHEIPSGSSVEHIGNQILVNGEPLPICNKKYQLPNSVKRALPADGWQTWTAYDNKENKTFTTFNGNMTVPQPPKDWRGYDPNTGVIYYFTGLQNDNWVPDSIIPSGSPDDFVIIQPVIQYGAATTPFGELDWVVSSWYVTVAHGVLYSTPITVQPNDNIYGIMQQTGSSSWFINSILPDGTSTNITVTNDNIINMPWSYCTLEVYKIFSCDYLPTSDQIVEFKNMVLNDENNNPVKPEWDILFEYTGRSLNPCNSSFVEIDPFNLNLQFQNLD